MPTLGFCKCCGWGVSNEATACPHCGQPNPYESDLLARALRSGNKINAIKIIREARGIGLKEAKDLIDSVWP